MEANFSPGVPIYLQIMDIIRRGIVSGGWQPGERVPSVRELSVQFGVNPNTVQRSLSELEREELLRTERTTGRFVTDDARIITRAQEGMAKAAADAFLQEMKGLGFSGAVVLDYVKKGLGGEAL